MSRVIVVTPTFEDRVASRRVFRELHAVLGDDVYVVAVDDGSVHEPTGREDLAASGVEGVVLTLRHNVGHQRAIAAGLSFASAESPPADCIVVMDSDGEDVPATVPDLLAGLDSSEADIVVARRRGRVASVRFRAFYRAYRMLFRMLTGRSMSFGNFMAMRPAAAQRLAAMPTTGRHLAASALASGLQLSYRPLDRGPRYAGVSKMRFGALARHGLASLAAFKRAVIVRIGVAVAVLAAITTGSAAQSLAILFAGVAASAWSVSGRRSVGGWGRTTPLVDHRALIARELHVGRAREH